MYVCLCEGVTDIQIAQQINAYDAKIAEYSDIIARAINYRDKLETERQELLIEYEGLL